MKIDYFKMERMQSQWEFLVDYNLSESGVHPLSFKELLPQEQLDEILQTSLGYLQTNGTTELREKVCALYPGTNIENVLITTGSAEANYLLAWSQIEPGDEVLFMIPNYMQLWGLMRAFGANVKTFALKEDLDWNPDPDELQNLVTPNTKIICVTNPNNPTGSRLSQETRDTILHLAKKNDAWIFADEVYQGAELDKQTTPSFFGDYEKVVVSNGLSKAYGLPGLRMGWIMGPEGFANKVWPYHDYTTISISAVSDRLARIALTPGNRDKILERTRTILNENIGIVKSWLKKHEESFHCIPPEAGAIVFPRYNLDINSTELVDRIREKKSVLIVPGDHFEMDRYLRIGYGEEKQRLEKALALIEEMIHEIRG
ncbi:MAG: aminotransferase class I/II-fold pyridoxal phosphate-dependent enzyme [Candidatus Aminicenantes bacterium]|nr:MAG: aminotransferase class I/II-fold pyridoxal phosphate-dependent enzyme [Candidatus Aminicenantes bacterium]